MRGAALLMLCLAVTACVRVACGAAQAPGGAGDGATQPSASERRAAARRWARVALAYRPEQGSRAATHRHSAGASIPAAAALPAWHS